jgi:hypothetical protein
VTKFSVLFLNTFLKMSICVTQFSVLFLNSFFTIRLKHALDYRRYPRAAKGCGQRAGSFLIPSSQQQPPQKKKEKGIASSKGIRARKSKGRCLYCCQLTGQKVQE